MNLNILFHSFNFYFLTFTFELFSKLNSHTFGDHVQISTSVLANGKAHKFYHYTVVQLMKTVYLLWSGLWRVCPPTHASRPTRA